MKKTVFLNILFMMTVLINGCSATDMNLKTSNVESSSRATEKSRKASEKSSKEESESAAPLNNLSGELFDFHLAIDSEIIAIPVSYADFTASGWELKDANAASEEIEANQYMLRIKFVKEDYEITVQMINLADGTKPLKECYIGKITVDTYYLRDTSHTTELPGGIVIGNANMDDVKATYGEPDNIYEGDSIITYTYKKALYQTVQFTFDTATKISTKVEMQNFSK